MFKVMTLMPYHAMEENEYTVEPPVATTSPQQPVFQNTKSFLAKSLQREPLVSDYLSWATTNTFRANSLKFSFVFNLP